MDADPEVYDCQTCEMAHQVGTLGRANAEAWAIFQRVCGRFAHEAGLMSLRLTLETDGWPAQDVIDLLDRLEIIYDEVMPPPEPPRGS